jgi:hypothetical protein
LIIKITGAGWTYLWVGQGEKVLFSVALFLCIFCDWDKLVLAQGIALGSSM